MDLLFKKTGLPSIEDFAKDIAVKKNLTNELGKSIRIIQEENVGKSIISDNECSNSLCSVLEAIFIHGLKDKLMRKMSSVFSGNSDKMPSPEFWTVVCNYSHKNVILEITRFNQVTTDVGRGRAWLRCALNDGLIVSYVGNMLSDDSSLQKHYSINAYMLDKEQSDIMKQLLEGLSVFSFELSCNNSTFNMWNSLPLTLANLWTPPITPQPVMPAVDVIDFFTDPKNSPKRDSTRVKRPSILDPVSCSGEEDTAVEFDSQSPGDSQPHITEDAKPENSSETTVDIDNEAETKEAVESLQYTIPESNSVPNEEIMPSSDAWNYEEVSSKVSSSDSVPDLGLEIIDSDQVGSMGNKLNENSGWSSTFDGERDSLSCDTDQSYDSLLQSYNKNLSKAVIGTPELADSFASVMKKAEDDDDAYSPETKSPDSDFEIVPKYYSDLHADEETKKLRSVIGQLCPEKGLNAQNFQCNSCGRPVGLIYGKARLCHYDGFSYCYDCHQNDEEFIPARIVHNWDFKQYPVSKRAKAYLTRVIKDPLLNIKILNPVIYTAVEEMAQVQILRTQLTFLRSYIFTCKEDIAEDLRKRLWPREYLFEHVHKYSLDDLLEIPQGVLAQTLQKVVVFAKKHISGCQLCLLKGFICEVCKNPKPIYPFDVESTYHCEKCLSVYHAPCMDASKYCPKCVRKMKRQQLLEISPD